MNEVLTPHLKKRNNNNNNKSSNIVFNSLLFNKETLFHFHEVPMVLQKCPVTLIIVMLARYLMFSFQFLSDAVVWELTMMDTKTCVLVKPTI